MQRLDEKTINQQTHKSARFIAIVPARGGSKGLPGKNLMKIQGISLVARAVLLAGQVPEISRVIVSTDDEKIAYEGERAGAEIPFLRPRGLARSDTPMVSVLEHAAAWLQTEAEKGREQPYDGFVLLAPTSPMRKLRHIRSGLHLFEKSLFSEIKAAGVISVSPVPARFAPWNTFKINDVAGNARRAPYLTNSNARFLKSLFFRNGAVVVLDPERLSALNLRKIPVIPYVIDKPLVSIDSHIDFLRVENCGYRLEPDPHKIGWDS